MMKNISHAFLSRSKSIAFFMIAFCLSFSFTNAADNHTKAYTPTSTNVATPDICGHQHVLSRINYQFRHGMRHIYKQNDIRITDYSDIKMTEYEQALPGSKFQRTFCSATAHMNDNTQRKVWYMVEQGKGLSGVYGIRVQECIEGLDPWRINNGFCGSVKR